MAAGNGYDHTPPESTPTRSPRRFVAPLQQRFWEFEAKILRWRHVRFAPPSGFFSRRSRSTSADPSKGACSTKGATPCGPSKPTLSRIEIGSMTSPVPRRIMEINLTPRSSNELTLGIFAEADADVTRRYEAIRSNAGVLNIDGDIFKDVRLGQLELISSLGNGASGSVSKMRFTRANKLMAVKKMTRTHNMDEAKRVIMDLEVVSKAHICPNIIRCYGYLFDNFNVHVCMELMATCLDKLLKRLSGPVPEEIIGKIAVSIVNALNYLKDEYGVMHRDVKPSNILLNWSGNVKLCDFGISGRLVQSRADTKAGCIAYMSPERITSKSGYDIRADVWSLGITLVELASGAHPYADFSVEFEVLSGIVENEPPKLSTKDGFSPLFCDFVAQCLQKECNMRPKYKDLMKHDFFHLYERKNVDVGGWLRRVLGEENPNII
uniref:mitogen-activated protein kinase kinase n=1 Tax=Steinernema glaseri TaxID=37863 RepID=A0A1I7XZY7_9BILA